MPENEHCLARQILRQAIDDLRIESLRIGREQLFEALYPALLDPATPVHDICCSPFSGAEIRLAVLRLRQRLRERVDARLRAVEPDAERRRALRRKLQALHAEPGESA